MQLGQLDRAALINAGLVDDLLRPPSCSPPKRAATPPAHYSRSAAENPCSDNQLASAGGQTQVDDSEMRTGMLSSTANSATDQSPQRSTARPTDQPADRPIARALVLASLRELKQPVALRTVMVRRARRPPGAGKVVRGRSWSAAVPGSSLRGVAFTDRDEHVAASPLICRSPSCPSRRCAALESRAARRAVGRAVS
jgi:hypothetical protein